VELIAIGNDTASRETDRLGAALIRLHPELELTKVVVSEAGASVYSASAFGSQEFDAHGRSYLDGLAGLYVGNVGHGRAEIAKAMAKQARELAYVSAASYTNLSAVHRRSGLRGGLDISK
jgi:adenosylmethionine-8-amino-7-oxononanoate aminotransferase